MSTIKITQLPLITHLNANTSNTMFVAVDTQAEITGKFTATTLAAGLYENNVLNVGNNSTITLPNVVAQFALRGESYVQTNFTNLSDGGTADYVITANTGTDTTYFVDLGFANKNFIPGSEYNSLGTSIEAMSGYLYVQGNTSGAVGGNLIIGTTSSNTETRFIAGGGTSANVIAKVTPAGLRLVNGKTLTFDDGSVQNTAAATLAYTVAAFTLANTNSNSIVYQTGVDVTQNTVSVAINSYAQSAFTLANTNSNSIVYQTGVDVAQNTNIQSAWTKANNALANTSGAVFDGNLTITGVINTGKGFIYTPTVFPNSQTAITIDFANDSVVRAQTATGLTVTLSNLVTGKAVEAWITNTSGGNQTFTHGVSAINSTINATSHPIPSTSTILVKYWSMDGTLANTFVSMIHA
jgi:hypothetical protein